MHAQQRRIVFVLLPVILVSLFIVPTQAARAAEKSVVWERFDVELQINVDGTFVVTERQSIRFMNGVFTFGYRTIPKNNLTFIDYWSVSDASGHTYTQADKGKEPYTFVVDDAGSEYALRWHFPATAAPETYTLRYMVHDGLRYYPDCDQLWWNAVYGDRSFPVLASQARVLVPSPAVAQQQQAYINGVKAHDAVTTEVLDDGRTVVFDMVRRLDAGEELAVRVEFTPGVVAGSAPDWQQDADNAAARRAIIRTFFQPWIPLAEVGKGAQDMVTILFATLIIALNPNSAYAHYDRGVAYGDIGNNINAIADLERAAELYAQDGQVVSYQEAMNQLEQLRNR